ncbi:MAG TPA: hypothetical protein H9844_04875 [Candidatus Evtepia faecigallinarum]|nr:hypothetical protein [Candidatus Evtepia faecigallinarum]
MKLAFQTAGPAGDLTLVVTTPVPPAEHSALARRLLAIGELQASRVCFLLPPEGKGVVRLAVPDGVLSGSALALGALTFAAARGVRREKKLPVELPGLAEPCTVHMNPLAGQATVELPLPRAAERTPFLDREVPVVVFPGLAHLLWPGTQLPPQEVLLPALQDLAQTWQVPAAGALAWDFRAQTITPLLCLPGEARLCPRPTCVTAAGAAAAWSALHDRQSHRKLAVRQPGGVLQAAAHCQGASLRRLTVSLPVSLGPAYEIDFEK